MADDVGFDLAEQLARDGADGDAGRGLTRAGPLEDVADIVVAVLDDAGEVGVSGPRQRDGVGRVLDGFGGHAVLPVGVVPVAHEHRHGLA